MPVSVSRDIFDPEKEYRSGIKQNGRIAYAWDDSEDNDEAVFNALAGPARLLRVAGDATGLLIPRSALGGSPGAAIEVSGDGSTADFVISVGQAGDGTQGAAVVHRDRVVLLDRAVASYEDANNWMFKGKVTSATGAPGALVLNDTERSFSEEHGLVNCRVTFTSGALNGETMEVNAVLSATSIQLDAPDADAPAAGDTYVIHPPALVLPDTYDLKFMSWWENTGIDVDSDLEDNGPITAVIDAVPSYRRRLHWCIYADNGSTAFPVNDVNGWFDSLYVDTIATLTVSSGTTVAADDVVLASGVFTPGGALLDSVVDDLHVERQAPGSWPYKLPSGVDAYPVSYVNGSVSGSDVTVSGGRVDAGGDGALGISIPPQSSTVNTDNGSILSSRGVIYYDEASGSILRAQAPTLNEGQTPLLAYAANGGTRVIQDAHTLAGPVQRNGVEYTCYGLLLAITPGSIIHSGAFWPVAPLWLNLSTLVPSPGPSQEYYIYLYNAGGGRLLNAAVLDITPPRGDGSYPHSVYSITADSDATFCYCIGLVHHIELASVSHWSGAYRAGRIYFGGVGGTGATYFVGGMTSDSTWTTLSDIPLAARSWVFRVTDGLSTAANSASYAIRQYYTTGSTTIWEAQRSIWAGTGFNADPIFFDVPNMTLSDTSILVQARVISDDPSPTSLVSIESVGWSEFQSQYGAWYALV